MRDTQLSFLMCKDWISCCIHVSEETADVVVVVVVIMTRRLERPPSRNCSQETGRQADRLVCVSLGLLQAAAVAACEIDLRKRCEPAAARTPMAAAAAAVHNAEAFDVVVRVVQRISIGSSFKAAH